MVHNLKRYGAWALVTGASSGIGLEFARAIAREGLNLVLVARRRQRLELLAEELKERNGIETLVIEQDLSLPDAVLTVAGKLENIEVGVLVLNAGFGITGNFIEQDPERLARMISVNCTSTTLLARLILPGMIERNQGAVIVVSSVLGFLPGPWNSVYSATKAFDLMLGESLWPEVKEHGIHVLNLCPATTRTEFHNVAGSPDRKKIHLAEPDYIVQLALKGLGRSLTVFPVKGVLASIFTRTLPRKWKAGLIGKIMWKRWGQR